MSLDADYLLDRRRLKRSRALWRGLAVFAVLAAIGVTVAKQGELPAVNRAHVARLEVSGTITEDRKVIEALDKAAKDQSLRALLVEIDSPGGTVTGGESLYEALKRVAAVKPVVALMGGTAASAGYMIAMPAERVFAREMTVTGSIGVLMQGVEVSGLLEKLGIAPQTIASGPLKDQPSPFRPLTPEGRAALQGVIDDLLSRFVAMVAEGRKMPEARVRELADGRIFTGRQALQLGLVDAIGGEPEARAWLASQKGVPASLPIREIDTRDSTSRLLGEAFGHATKTVISEWLGVDRVLALWQLRP
ncbi:signal peptide peptidase SppA [Acetobacteraceae bacterium H6797]|nr:signal peptide peptidase SppA [Acetobacteraceae bacterium H6797]